MKLFKKSLATLAVIGVTAAYAVPAQAGYVVMDSWQLTTPTSSTSDIGRLNLVSGTATIEQEVDNTGNVFVGADFSEDGTIYSISYTPDNVVGGGDVGAPVNLAKSLTIIFSDVVGHVTGFVGSGFSYVFDSGQFTITSADGGTSSGSIVGIGGTAAATGNFAGTNGDSSLLGLILASSGLGYFDSLGNNLAPLLATGDVAFLAVTNNNINTLAPSGACSFDATANCLKLSATSAGDAYLVQVVPEPATLALTGLALFGLGAMRRRREVK